MLPTRRLFRFMILKLGTYLRSFGRSKSQNVSIESKHAYSKSNKLWVFSFVIIIIIIILLIICIIIIKFTFKDGFHLPEKYFKALECEECVNVPKMSLADKITFEVGLMKLKKQQQPRPLSDLIYTLPQVEKDESIELDDTLPPCKVNVSNLEKATINDTKVDIKLKRYFKQMRQGGHYLPNECLPKYKVAILIPYRDLEHYLGIFLFNIHSFLIKQKLHYRIFVLEQTGKDYFNKGALFNAGFKEIDRYGRWDCVIFHDVDLMPMDDRILYSCPTHPTHMCAAVMFKNGQLNPLYVPQFGGVIAMTGNHVKSVNGYSNLFWGLGGEDIDMFWRLSYLGYNLTRYDSSVAIYLELPHSGSHRIPHKDILLQHVKERYQYEGLSTVNYRIQAIILRHLCTHFYIDVNPDKENVNNARWREK